MKRHIIGVEEQSTRGSYCNQPSERESSTELHHGFDEKGLRYEETSYEQVLSLHMARSAIVDLEFRTLP